MKVIDTSIDDVKIFEPTVYGDKRGFFFESFRASWFKEYQFVQDNHSKSSKGTLRGIHYQLQKPQGKLVRVSLGRVLDVAVDLRRASPTFGQHVAQVLDDQNRRQLWVPPGFGHGFYVMSDVAEFQYKCTEYYDAQDERAIKWDDPTLAINWRNSETPLLSDRDRSASAFTDANVFE